MREKPFRIGVMAALTILLAMPAVGATSIWKIDPVHSSAQFSVRHMAISTVRGEFSKLNGTIVYDDQDVTKSKVEVTIDTSTVDTREPDRDKDVRSANFLDVAKYPSMTFKSTGIEQTAPGKLKVTGDLTIHGVTKSVVLSLDGPTAPIKDPFGMRRMAASATTSINRQEFGINWNHTLDNGGLVVSNEVAITLDVEMVQPLSGK